MTTQISQASVITPILTCPNVDSATSLSLGTSTATSISIGKTTTSTVINGKGYLASTRPILSGGFSMITNTTISNTTTETSIIGAGVGTLTGAANTSSAGNSSRLRAGGTVNITASPTITLRIYGGATSTTLLASFAIALATLSANSPWQLNSEFCIKTIGAAGVASVQLNSTFQVFDTTSVNSYVNQTLNNTTFDTTVNNIILITAQWSAASASNTFITNMLTTHTVYVV